MKLTSNNITIPTLEKHLPEDIVQLICKKAHTCRLREVHEEMKYKHFITTFFAAIIKTPFQVSKIKVDMFEGYNMYFFTYRQNNKYIILGYWDDSIEHVNNHIVIMITALQDPKTNTYHVTHTFTSHPHKLDILKRKSYIESMFAWTLGKKNLDTSFKSTKFSNIRIKPHYIDIFYHLCKTRRYTQCSSTLQS